MTINDENQQQDNDKIEHPTENSIDRSWILQLAPTTVTLIPSDQSYLIESQQGNYVDVVRYGKPHHRRFPCGGGIPSFPHKFWRQLGGRR